MQEMNAEHKIQIGEMTAKGNTEKEETSKRMGILEAKINSLLEQQQIGRKYNTGKASEKARQ